MKVLKEGRQQQGWSHELVCKEEGGCGALLLVEEPDLWAVDHTYYVGETDTPYYWMCSECGTHHTLREPVPWYVHNRIRKNKEPKYTPRIPSPRLPTPLERGTVSAEDFYNK